MLTIDVNELQSKKYKSFITYAFSTCNCLSFVINKESSNNCLTMLEEGVFSSVLKKEFVLVHPDTGTHFDSGYMITVECSEYIKSLFLNAYCIDDFNGNDFPEELCFYRSGVLWFKFISHEKLIFIQNENGEDIEFFRFKKIDYKI